MKFLELCAGVGGFRYALKKFGAECVGFSEIDKYAIKLYSAFWGDERNFGDVTKINADELPNFDLLVGGFPCQAFSVAGSRKGFDDTRGTIFFDFLRILKAKKPKYFLFENVKGLLNHDKGNTFKIIIEELENAGYAINTKLYNTKNYGLPQNRERIYIGGFYGAESCGEILSKPGEDSEFQTLRKIGKINDHQKGGVFARSGIAPCLTATMYKDPPLIKVGEFNKGGQGDRVYSDSGISVTLNSQSGGRGAKTGLYQVGNSPVIRRLTPKECFRLQGFAPFTKGENGLIFDDSLVELGYKIGISDTQLYKIAGNAVSVPVVEVALKELLNFNFMEDKKC